jgi:hypothetical protein
LETKLPTQKLKLQTPSTVRTLYREETLLHLHSQAMPQGLSDGLNLKGISFSKCIALE